MGIEPAGDAVAIIGAKIAAAAPPTSTPKMN